MTGRIRPRSPAFQAASSSAVVTQTVNNVVAPPPAGTTTSLTASPTTIKAAFFVTLTATVNTAGGVPTGTVTFSDGATVLGTVTLNASGQATLVTRKIQTLGAHPITATYTGDSTFPGSTSAVVTVTVVP